MLFSECATHRDLYLVLERRKAEIKSHTSKMKSHRDSLSSKVRRRLERSDSKSSVLATHITKNLPLVASFLALIAA